VPRKRKLSVKIPPGISDGQAVRVQGEGEPPPPELAPGGEGVRGDLHVVVRIKEHELFHRDGDHLVLEMPIAFTQAALGAEVQAPTLEGSAPLKVPRGTQYGAMFRVSGHGLPNLRNGRRGDLVVVAKIEIPKRISAKQEKLLREFAETENLDVMPESQGFLKKMKDWLGG
jgi:molecular chaperone DnaJ